jgi:hypothetical protein
MRCPPPRARASAKACRRSTAAGNRSSRAGIAAAARTEAASLPPALRRCMPSRVRPSPEALQTPEKGISQSKRHEKDDKERERRLNSEGLLAQDAEGNAGNASNPEDRQHREQVAVGAARVALADGFVGFFRGNTVRGEEHGGSSLPPATLGRGKDWSGRDQENVRARARRPARGCQRRRWPRPAAGSSRPGGRRGRGARREGRSRS